MTRAIRGSSAASRRWLLARIVRSGALRNTIVIKKSKARKSPDFSDGSYYYEGGLSVSRRQLSMKPSPYVTEAYIKRVGNIVLDIRREANQVIE